ncbi:P-loop containing nucleoside triphosphate hydrolase protein [Chlamydoabsidia padenii]|nr:P-loop containing nucleoside triphosphate hydrolase protein [Chlamydoabsidia padenii]
MPLALSKVRSMRFIYIVEKILYFLENITEETFWHGIFGERLTKLAQRYFGNDFVMLGILFYIAPILRTSWEKLVEHLMDRLGKQTKTVNARVYYQDDSFNAIQYYIKKYTEQLPELIDAIALYEESKPGAANENSDEDENPTVGVYPRNNTDNEIVYKGHVLTVSFCKEDEEKATSHGPDYINISMTTSPTETIDTLRDILQEWCDNYNDNEDNNIKILQWNGYDSWYQKNSVEPRGYDSVNLPTGIKENLLCDMKRFIKRQNWYKSKGLPYRRGYLLYGPPGTGKTSLITLCAAKLHYNLALIKLGELDSDTEFSNCISATPKNTLLIIEDVDHYDELADSVTKSGLLNALDGIDGNDGSMVFMTCNDMNKITPALLRPGRMDVKLELGYAVHEQIEAMFWRFFATPDFGDDNDDINVVEEEDQPVIINNDLPTPVSEDEDKDRITHLNAAIKKLLTLIPERHVTTAEMQSFFVALFLEIGGSGDKVSEQDLLKRLFERVPEFLERIRLDREQAKLHDKLTTEDKGDNTDDSEKTDDDTSDQTDD